MTNRGPTTFLSLVLVLITLLIALHATAMAQSENHSQADGLYNDNGTDSRDGENPKNLKMAANKIVLPEGYPISGQRAKLVMLPDDHRWFLVFDEAIKKFIPEFVSNDPQKDATSNHSMTKAGKNTTGSNKKASKTGSAVNNEPENPFSQPIEVLPGSRLTAMIMYVGNRVDLSVDLRVWGEVTTYHKRNYILPTRVGTLSLFGKDALKKVKKKKTNPLDTTFGPPKPQDTKTAKKAQVADTSKIPRKLRDALSSIPRTRPLELPDAKQIRSASKPAVAVSKTSGAKKTASVQTDWRDGYMIIDRVGRMHFDPEGLRWMFSFESDGTSLAEPPVTLHPCRLLEIMETAVGRSSDSLRFRVSGQISQYQGRNYMLLRKVLMVYDLENLVQ